MLTNLFSIFDPATSINYSMNWLSIFLPFIFFPKNFWFKKSKFFMFWFKFFSFLTNELKNLMKKTNSLNIFFFLILINIFIYSNFLGLSPYIFTPSSHLSVNLSLSLTLWISLMFFGWIKKTIHMLAHLVPLNTPFMLMFFMVLIESTSNLIRPFTLAIRLAANMISGHLLLCLMGSMGFNLSIFILPLMLSIQIILFYLEMAVSIIQAYVFMMLCSLYTNEIYDKS